MNWESWISSLFSVYYMLIIAYIIMSWLPNVRNSFVGELLGKVVEPYLTPFRRIIPSIGPIDISPIVALFALQFVQIGVKVLIRLIVGGV